MQIQVIKVISMLKKHSFMQKLNLNHKSLQYFIVASPLSTLRLVFKTAKEIDYIPRRFCPTLELQWQSLVITALSKIFLIFRPDMDNTNLFEF